MGEAFVWNDRAALALFLQMIITNLPRGIQSLFPTAATSRMCFWASAKPWPKKNASKTISLEVQVLRKACLIHFRGVVAGLI
jgi:hypothetical protein